jgi:hypothetical protein
MDKKLEDMATRLLKANGYTACGLPKAPARRQREDEKEPAAIPGVRAQFVSTPFGGAPRVHGQRFAR